MTDMPSYCQANRQGASKLHAARIKSFHTCFSLVMHGFSWRGIDVGTVMLSGLRCKKGCTIVFLLNLCRFGGRLPLLSITKIRIDCSLNGGSNRLAPSSDCRSQRLGLFDSRDRALREAQRQSRDNGLNGVVGCSPGAAGVRGRAGLIGRRHDCGTWKLSASLVVTGGKIDERGRNKKAKPGVQKQTGSAGRMVGWQVREDGRQQRRARSVGVTRSWPRAEISPSSTVQTPSSSL